MKEFRPLIKQMEATNSPILITFKDVISVNDHICKLVEQNEKVDEELADIFEIGFGFLTNTLEDLKVYYNDYFKKNILELNHYAPLILYHIYLDDFKWHLLNKEEMNEERSKVIDRIESEIDSILVGRGPFNHELIDSYEEEIRNITPFRDDFHAVYTVFSMIAEELNIF
jgi:hypothetical protein